MHCKVEMSNRAWCSLQSPQCKAQQWPLCSAPPSDLHVNSPPATQPVPNKPKTMPLPWTQISQTIVLCVLECKCTNPIAAPSPQANTCVHLRAKTCIPGAVRPEFPQTIPGLLACLVENNAGSPRPKNVNGLRGTDRSYLLRFH